MQEAAQPVEDRKGRLLNQLDNPGLRQREIERIKQKLEVLDTQKE